MIKQKVTNKLFYNKWKLKISFYLPSSSFTRYKSLEEISLLDDKNRSPYRYYNEFLAHKQSFLDLYGFLETRDKNSYNIRVESNLFDVYTNDEDIISGLSDIIDHEKIRYVQRPDPGHESLLSDRKTIIVKKYPQNRFKMRVYLKPHTVTSDDEKLRITNWIKTQPGISMSEAVELWFLRTKWNWDRRYLLVEDEKALLMLKLKCPSVVGTVYNLIVQI